jgi:CrcB protein
MVLVGGGFGALVRFIIGAAITERFTGRFPLATFIINVTGSFMAGLLMTLFTERFEPHPNWRLLLVVGVMGGYTTFSTFEYETFRTAQDGGSAISFLYVVASVVMGYAAVWAGAMIARVK